MLPGSVSSDASPTRPEWAVNRSPPGGLGRRLNRRPPSSAKEARRAIPLTPGSLPRASRGASPNSTTRVRACHERRGAEVHQPLPTLPRVVGFDDRVDLGHSADGLVQGDDDLLVVGNVLDREHTALPVLEPLVADLVPADVEVPNLLGDPLETHRAGLARAVAVTGVGLAGVEPDGAVRPADASDFGDPRRATTPRASRETAARPGPRPRQPASSSTSVAAPLDTPAPAAAETAVPGADRRCRRREWRSRSARLWPAAPAHATTTSAPNRGRGGRDPAPVPGAPADPEPGLPRRPPPREPGPDAR